MVNGLLSQVANFTAAAETNNQKSQDNALLVTRLLAKANEIKNKLAYQTAQKTSYENLLKVFTRLLEFALMG